MHLSKLLRLDEIVSVTVPSVARETARDLVRAREDARGDLMRARYQVSKLLLRQGIVYYGGSAWTGTHLRWLRKQHFDAPGLQLAFDAEHEEGRCGRTALRLRYASGGPEVSVT
jgi:transposase